MAKAKETYTQEKAAYDARSPEEVAAADAAQMALQAVSTRVSLLPFARPTFINQKSSTGQESPETPN